jgi:hypothetical protein
MTVSPFDGIPQMCVVGDSIFRVFKYTDSLKLAHQTKIEKICMCNVWIDDSMIAVGTHDSKIILVQNGECILEISYLLPHFDSSPCSSIAVQESGLLLGLDNGVIVFFQKTEDHYYYKKVREVLLEESKVVAIAVSPHEEVSVITLENSQIYKVTMECGLVLFR